MVSHSVLWGAFAVIATQVVKRRQPGMADQ
jgi:hypothetical protein